jgi:hypothetical protein
MHKIHCFMHFSTFCRISLISWISIHLKIQHSIPRSWLIESAMISLTEKFSETKSWPFSSRVNSTQMSPQSQNCAKIHLFRFISELRERRTILDLIFVVSSHQGCLRFNLCKTERTRKTQNRTNDCDIFNIVSSQNLTVCSLERMCLEISSSWISTAGNRAKESDLLLQPLANVYARIHSCVICVTWSNWSIVRIRDKCVKIVRFHFQKSFKMFSNEPASRDNAGQYLQMSASKVLQHMINYVFCLK